MLEYRIYFIFIVTDNGILQGRAVSAMADIDYQMYSLLNQIPAAIKDARWGQLWAGVDFYISN